MSDIIADFNIDIQTGLIAPAQYLSSSNCDARPDGATLDLIVIHAISLPPGIFGGEAITQLFSNRLDPAEHPYYATIATARVSAHLLVRRQGELIQYVPFLMRAWHAGRSHYQGRERCNDFSIGIELEGSDDMPYESTQYRVLAGLIKSLLFHYPSLSDQHIVGHSDIAPGRKTDPGPSFDWQHFRHLLYAKQV